MSDFPIGYKAAAADRENYDRIIADIQRAEAKSQEMQQLADRTEVLAEQSDHRLRELKTKRLNILANPATHGDWRVTLE
jgi:hypothetical protein